MNEELNLEVLGYNDLEPLIARLQTLTDNYYTVNPDIIPSGIGASWGQIKGTLSNQKDLMNYLAQLQKTLEDEIEVAVGSIFVYKGSVETIQDLNNIQNPNIGDTYNVEENGANYTWNGTEWDKLSETIDLENYVDKEDLNNALELYYLKSEIDQLISDLQDLINAKADKSDIQDLQDADQALDDRIDEVITDTNDALDTLEQAIDKVADDLQKHIDDAETGYVTNAQLSEAVSTLQGEIDTLDEKAVKYVDISTPENPNRKAIVLSNHDGIFGKDIQGNTRNLAMISKYDVADFGTPHLHTNLNTQQIVTVNDNQAILTDKNLNNVILPGTNIDIDTALVTEPNTGFIFQTLTINADLSEYYTKLEVDDLLQDMDVGQLRSDLDDEIQARIDADDSLDSRVTALEDGATTIFHYKGSKATVADLDNIQNPQVGDVWNIEETGANYCYNGEEWDKLSETIDLSPFMTKEEFETEIVNYAAKADLSELANTVTDAISGQDGSIQALLLQMTALESMVQDLKSLDPEVVVLYDGCDTDYENEEKDFILSGAVTNPTVVEGRNINLKDATVTAANFDAVAVQDVTIKDVVFDGTLPKAVSNCLLAVRCDGYVTIRDCSINPTSAYNGIEIGLTGSVPRTVTIDNLDFTGHFINNGINIFGIAENGVVTISNCRFEDLSNVVRVSNRLNMPWTLNIINCVCEKWEANLDYTGMILLQDYTSGSAEAANENDQFSKLTINIQNCTKPDGTKILPVEDLGTICGSRDNNQIIYMWDAWRNHTSYGPKYPTINII